MSAASAQPQSMEPLSVANMPTSPSGRAQLFTSTIVLLVLSFDNLILGRGFGSIAIVRPAFGVAGIGAISAALGVIAGTAGGSVGKLEVVSTAGRSATTISLSAFARGSELTKASAVVCVATLSSKGEIDAATLLAQSPAMTARQIAASQTVLIIPTPNASR
jgi:hypothetical protein